MNPAGDDSLSLTPKGPPTDRPVMPPPAPPRESSGPPSEPPQDLSGVVTADPDAPAAVLFRKLQGEIAKVYVGQDDLVLSVLVAIFSGGHVLIESVPGLGKTLLVRVLAKVLGCRFQRIQFTPDLMPSDVTGQPVFDQRSGDFVFRPGPVFSQLLLADEINRAPAKTHAALLEIMQEKRVTVDGVGHTLEPPFVVLATQNPIESEGTYSLPEAQLDRFMFKVSVLYPPADQEQDILRLHCRPDDLDDQLENRLEVVTGPEEIVGVQRSCAAVTVHDKMIRYIAELVRRTREQADLYMGASPRAGIALLRGARTLAALSGRDYCTPDDVAELFLPALRHRVLLAPEAEVEGREADDVLTDVLRSVEVPRL